MPWTWTAFESPIMLLAFALVLATVLPESSRGAPRLAEHLIGDRARWDHRFSRYLTFIAEWAHVWVVSALAAIVFLGGWNVPGAGTALGEPRPWLAQLAGAFVLALKTWVLVGLVVGVRWVALRVAREDLLGLWFRYLFPLSVVNVGLTLGSTRLALDQALSAEAKSALAMAVFTVVATILGLFSLRVFRGLRGGVAPASLNPWL